MAARASGMRTGIAPHYSGRAGRPVSEFWRTIKDTAAWSAKLKAAGLDVLPPFTGAEGFPNAYATTTDGVRIELQEDKMQKEDIVAYHLHFLTPDSVKLM